MGAVRGPVEPVSRRAGALATPPGEHNVRPGWLFLDEPLSSFDRGRTQALADLLARGLARKQFAQILLISHSDSVDPAEFDRHLRMEEGRIAGGDAVAHIAAP
jgi:predicted ABC-type transport system involved in lysophospholipase L1 biosynthesis ATPase subunit